MDKAHAHLLRPWAIGRMDMRPNEYQSAGTSIPLMPPRYLPRRSAKESSPFRKDLAIRAQDGPRILNADEIACGP